MYICIYIYVYMYIYICMYMFMNSRRATYCAWSDTDGRTPGEIRYTILDSIRHLAVQTPFFFWAAPVASRSKSSDLKCRAPISNQNWMPKYLLLEHSLRDQAHAGAASSWKWWIWGHDDRNSSSMFEIATLTYLLSISVFTASEPCISAGFCWHLETVSIMFTSPTPDNTYK